MICPNCKESIKYKPKKNEVLDCICGAKIIAIEINKRTILCDVTENRGNKNVK